MINIKSLYYTLLGSSISFLAAAISTAVSTPSFINKNTLYKIYEIEKNNFYAEGAIRVIFSKSVEKNGEIKNINISFDDFIYLFNNTYKTKYSSKIDMINSKLQYWFNDSFDIDNISKEAEYIKTYVNSSKEWDKYKKEKFKNYSYFSLTAFETVKYFNHISNIKDFEANDKLFIVFISFSTIFLTVIIVLSLMIFLTRSKSADIYDDASEYQDSNNIDKNNINDELDKLNRNRVDISNKNLIEKISKNKEMVDYLNNRTSVGFKNPILQKKDVNDSPKITITSKKNSSIDKSNNIFNKNKNLKNEKINKEFNKLLKKEKRKI